MCIYYLQHVTLGQSKLVINHFNKWMQVGYITHVSFWNSIHCRVKHDAGTWQHLVCFYIKALISSDELNIHICRTSGSNDRLCWGLFSPINYNKAQFPTTLSWTMNKGTKNKKQHHRHQERIRWCSVITLCRYQRTCYHYFILNNVGIVLWLHKLLCEFRSFLRQGHLDFNAFDATSGEEQHH